MIICHGGGEGGWKAGGNTMEQLFGVAIKVVYIGNIETNYIIFRNVEKKSKKFLFK